MAEVLTGGLYEGAFSQFIADVSIPENRKYVVFRLVKAGGMAWFPVVADDEDEAQELVGENANVLHPMDRGYSLSLAKLPKVIREWLRFVEVKDGATYPITEAVDGL
jgi:hypothetical protein